MPITVAAFLQRRSLRRFATPRDTLYERSSLCILSLLLIRSLQPDDGSPEEQHRDDVKAIPELEDVVDEDAEG